MASAASIVYTKTSQNGMFGALWGIKHRQLALRRRISTVEAGTAYENLVVSAFNRMGARLERVGGASDQGIDFRGPWELPGQSPFYVVGQCKFYERKKIGPSVIREWEGVMSRQEIDTLGILSASSGFTAKGVRTALSSEYPIALVTLCAWNSSVDGSGAEAAKAVSGQQMVRGFVWNRAAMPFIGRFIVAKKHYDTQVVHVEDPAEYEIELLWDGRPLMSNNGSIEADTSKQN
ncbi:hypothetical protein GGI12_004797 [Dipsacomyces acuminosporus]|nr:hypothetical protein GGI12_004797 [Dipsacomyces acuminosporus]